ncbi:MAG: hydantoinase B/oxoprolinase family protein [Gaiellaceae bacterium]
MSGDAAASHLTYRAARGAAAARYDPVTLEIVESSLQATSDEMFGVMRKTAMSAIIYEVLDLGTCVTDAEGNLAAAGAGIPAFVGTLDKAVKRLLELHRLETIEPGDVFATNDPFYGGVTHLNDVVFAMPVFADDRLVAWTANIAHWNDVGGMVPGSISNEAHELFQEGLRLPGIKLIARGEPIRPVIEIMRVNSRLPDFLLGDMWSGIAAVRLGAARVEELVRKYGADTLVVALERYLDRGELGARRALTTLPHGRFELSERQDSGAVYTVSVEISDDAFVVDLRDNPDQDAGSANLGRDGALVSAQMVFTNVTDPHGIVNGGTFRPLQVLTREGSIFDAREPAAFGVYAETMIRLYDLIWRCLAPHVDGRLPAGHYASICGTFIGGRHPDTGRHFTVVEPQLGGWGATSTADGNSAMFTGMHGDTFNCPVEVAEARYGLDVEQLALNEAPGGAGERCGGRGIVLDYRVRGGGIFFTCAYTRAEELPWALEGGREGSANYVELIRADGSRERHGVATALQLNAGDLIRIRTGTGGGHGDPRRRPRELVLEDMRNGLVTAAEAAEVYGLERELVDV